MTFRATAHKNDKRDTLNSMHEN